jgi:hypothetical protein
LSLIVTLRHNYETAFGAIYAHRIEGGDQPDDCNIYRYDLVHSTTTQGVDSEKVGATPFASGTVQHRYGDGGFKLLALILQDAGLFDEREARKDESAQ